MNNPKIRGGIFFVSIPGSSDPLLSLLKIFRLFKFSPFFSDPLQSFSNPSPKFHIPLEDGRFRGSEECYIQVFSAYSHYINHI